MIRSRLARSGSARRPLAQKRLLVVAVGVGGVAGQAVALVAGCGCRLGAAEELAADHLGIRRQKPQPAAVAVAGELVLAEPRKGGLELDVAGEGWPVEPISGFLRSLQMPVRLRWRIRSPLQTCSPSPPTSA